MKCMKTSPGWTSSGPGEESRFMTVADLPETSSPRAGAPSAFRVETDGDLAILWFDLPGEKVNKFSTAVMRELDRVLDDIAGMSGVKRLLIASRKPNIFIAGADINEFTQVTSVQQA